MEGGATACLKGGGGEPQQFLVWKRDLGQFACYCLCMFYSSFMESSAKAKINVSEVSQR